jgi:imidazolonepropionase-like amidohydrolase
MLKRGFTTIRDCGGAGVAMKEALAENLHPGPRLFTCGHAISQTGGHGDLRSAKDAEYDVCSSSGHAHGYGRVADGVDQCLRAAREELRQGADFIKIMVSGGVASPTDRLTSLQYTLEEIRAFVQVAASAGTYVTAHAYTAAAIRRAVESGVRGVEHGTFLDEATAALMAEKGAFLTPTLITYASMSAPEFSTFLPPAIAAKNAHVLSVGLNSLQIADKAGVTMCFGTDLLGAMQSKQTGEFALRKRAGLSAVKILQSATTNAARLLQQEDRLGRLREGAAADILILNANPLEDIEVLDRPRKHLLAVIKNGRVLESRWYALAKDVEREPIIE